MILSIIIPTYNRVFYLKRMIQSVVAQIEKYGASKDVEIVISDNCSTDETAAYVKNFIATAGSLIVTYNRNPVNIGVVKNILELIKLAKGEFCMFYGDDDLLGQDSLKEITQTLYTNRELPVFIFNQKNNRAITANDQIGIHECASKFFYYMGNACAALKTSFAKENVEKYYNDLTSTCWPQTHLMFLGMYDAALPKPVGIRDIVVYEGQPKDNNNIVNPFYYYDSAFYSLLRLGKQLSIARDKLLYNHITSGIPSTRKSNYWAFCRNLIELNKLYASKKEKLDFKLVVRESIYEIKGLYKLYVIPIWILNQIPSPVFKFFYLTSKSIYYSFSKGKKGTLFFNYKLFRDKLDNEKKDRLINKQKPHAITVNKGDW